MISGASETSLQQDFEGRNAMKRRHRDRDPRGRLLLARAGTAAPPRRSHLHPGRIHRRGERQPDRREPSGSRRGGRDRLRPRADLLPGPARVLLPDPPTRPWRRLVGSDYRSEIFYTSDEQRQVAEDTIADVDAAGHLARQGRDQDQRGRPLLGGRGRRSGLPPALSGRLQLLPAAGPEAANRETAA